MDAQIVTLLLVGVPALIALAILVLGGIIVWRVWLARDVRRRNESEPVLTYPARVVGKRDSVSGGGSNQARSHYFVTFERPDLQRVELEVEGREFGMLAEGDQGRLTHQGTWYRGFVRDIPPTPPAA